MAFNNGFPMGYQPAQIIYPVPAQMPQPMTQQIGTQMPAQMQQTSQTQPQQPAPPPQSSIIWVQGEAGAKSYLVAPNTSVQLWDSESQTIYLKSADANGIPSLRILDYVFRDMAPPTAPKAYPVKAEYVTAEDFKAFQADVERRIEALAKKEKGEIVNESIDEPNE